MSGNKVFSIKSCSEFLLTSNVCDIKTRKLILKDAVYHSTTKNRNKAIWEDSLGSRSRRHKTVVISLFVLTLIIVSLLSLDLLN